MPAASPSLRVSILRRPLRLFGNLRILTVGVEGILPFSALCREKNKSTAVTNVAPFKPKAKAKILSVHFERAILPRSFFIFPSPLAPNRGACSLTA